MPCGRVVSVCGRHKINFLSHTLIPHRRPCSEFRYASNHSFREDGSIKNSIYLAFPPLSLFPSSQFVQTVIINNLIILWLAHKCAFRRTVSEITFASFEIMCHSPSSNLSNFQLSPRVCSN